MKRTVCYIIIALLCACTAFAQEFSTWTIRVYGANSLATGSNAPVDLTKESSVRQVISSGWFNPDFREGDYITKISFRGYNSGKDVRRHLKVWMKNDDSYRITDVNTDVSQMTCVFDGDCTIPGGGTEAEHITLLDIPFSSPFLFTRQSFFALKIECTGDPVEEPVYFESYEDSFNKHYPTTIITVQSPVVYFSGSVINQDGQPVPNAYVRFHGGNVEYTASTNGQGLFKARIERGNNIYYYDITAEGCADYIEDANYIRPKGKDVPDLNYMVYDAVRYKKDEPATIVLPTTPDPTLGRYYRFNRYESEPPKESFYYFTREETPQANVPYVVFPNHDFEIHPADYDTKGIEPEDNRVYNAANEGESYIKFVGSYQSKIIRYPTEGEFIFFVYLTPDCSYGIGEWGISHQFGRLGAFRACFMGYGVYHRLYRDAPYSYVFDGEPAGIVQLKEEQDGYGATTGMNGQVGDGFHTLFDLQGRRLTATPQRGMYIRDGRKYVVR